MFILCRFSFTSSVQCLNFWLEITFLLTGLKKNYIVTHKKSVNGLTIQHVGNKILTFTIWFTGFSIYHRAPCSYSVSHLQVIQRGAQHSGKEMRTTGVRRTSLDLTLPLINCVALEKLLQLFYLWFSQL